MADRVWAAMAAAKRFQHEGSQAMRLPRAFRFEGAEVVIKKRGEEFILTPRRRPEPETLNDAAREMREHFSQGADIPDIDRPAD